MTTKRPGHEPRASCERVTDASGAGDELTVPAVVEVA